MCSKITFKESAILEHSLKQLCIEPQTLLSIGSFIRVDGGATAAFATMTTYAGSQRWHRPRQYKADRIAFIITT